MMKYPRNWTKVRGLHFDGASETFPRMTVSPSGFELKQNLKANSEASVRVKYLRK